ncbi:MAG: molybdopterin molybdenumtransferase MoeA, partial [Thermomicrobiales bacterium]
RALGGYAEEHRTRLLVRLAHANQPTDRIDHQRARIRQDEESGLLVGSTTGAQGSSRLASFTGSNGLLIIPPRDEPYESGEMVQALLLGSL